MKLTIEINDQKLAEHVENLVAEQIASKLRAELGADKGRLSYQYHIEIRKIIREVIKENYDALAKEAVSAAAKSIENRAVKNKLLKALEE